MAGVFNSVTCSVRYDNARVISWNLIPNYAYPADIEYTVERSRAGGQWIPIASGLQDVCAYIDTEKRNFNKYLNDFYRVVLTSPSTGETYVSDSCAAGITEAYPFSSEAANAISQIEKEIELTGRHGVLLKKKEWGKPCPKCTDFNGQSTVNEHCPVCLGTGIDGGYYDGIPLNVTSEVPEVLQQMSQLGVVQSSKMTVRCIAYPWITRGDVWCDTTSNERFYIANVTPRSMYKNVPMVFALTMTKVELTDAMHSPAADTKVATDNPWDDALVTYDPVSTVDEEAEEPEPEQGDISAESDTINWKEALSKL